MKIILFLFWGLNNEIAANDGYGCTMVCIDHVNLSLDADCESTVTYRTLLRDPDNIAICQPNGYQAFKVSIYDENGSDIGNKVNETHIGKTLQVRIKHWYTGNYCWGTITVEDKLGPWTTCPDDIIINCTDSTDPSEIESPTFMDCSDFTVDYYDEIIYKDCPSDISKIIKRTWIATDIFGNSKSCSQYIKIKRSSLSEVVGPVNYDGTSAPDQPALSCGASTLPEDLGGSGAFPTIGGQPIPSGNQACKINVTYEDSAHIPTCGNGYKIIREWLVIDWCGGSEKRFNQIIKVGDEIDPVISCTEKIYAGTNSTECRATVTLPPAIVSDDCSAVFVRINTPFGQINGNGGTLNNLIPIGVYEITYVATDECGNQAMCKAELIVEDDDAPVAICDQSTVVSLGSDAVTMVNAKVFDSGSYDNCAQVDFVATRETDFDKYVPFTCDDVDNGIIMVRLRVFEVGNPSSYSECMVEVIVQDKIPPTLVSCPPDVLVDCDDLADELSVYGSPVFDDNCGFEVIPNVKRELDNCGVGKITRTWVASDVNGSVICQQVITVMNNTPFDGSTIVFPSDVTLTECGSEITEEIIGKPIIPNYVECGLLSVNYVDETYNGDSEACFKIIRKWKIIDWCQYNPAYDPHQGKWEHYQTIKVLDNEKPELFVPSDIVLASTENNCQSAYVEIPLASASDCNPNVHITNNSPYAYSSGASASGRYPYGTTVVTFTANDGCGNIHSDIVTITVVDGKKPSPICLSGVVVEMGQNGSAEIWASDLEASSSDNCTSTSDLKLRIRVHEGSLENLTPPSTDNITLSCEVFDNIDTPNGAAVPIELWVGDEAGNWDFCLTFIAVQDNMDACPDPTDVGSGDVYSMISGIIETSKGSQVKDVDLNLISNNPLYDQFVQGINGNYVFTNLESGMNYSVTPSKTDDYVKGISTYDILKITRHVLGSEEFLSPYQIIAADANGDGKVSTSDVLVLRRLVLGLKTDFDNNQSSWNFVPTNYRFTDPTNPLEEDFARSLSFDQLNDEIYDANFIGIKIGDINDSATSDLISSDHSTTRLSLLADDQIFNAGEEVKLILNGEKIGRASGMQFLLQIDENVLEINDVKAVGDFTLDASNYRLQSNEFGFSWVTNNDTELGEFLEISFRAKNEGTLSRSINIKDGNQLRAEFYDETHETHGLNLQFESNLSTDPDFGIFPNPFHDVTSISLELEQSQEVGIQVFDISGRQVFGIRHQLDSGTNLIELRNSDLNGPGVYYVQIRHADHIQTKKLVLAY